MGDAAWEQKFVDKNEDQLSGTAKWKFISSYCYIQCPMCLLKDNMLLLKLIFLSLKWRPNKKNIVCSFPSPNAAWPTKFL